MQQAWLLAPHVSQSLVGMRAVTSWGPLSWVAPFGGQGHSLEKGASLRAAQGGVPRPHPLGTLRGSSVSLESRGETEVTCIARRPSARPPFSVPSMGQGIVGGPRKFFLPLRW